MNESKMDPSGISWNEIFIASHFEPEAPRLQSECSTELSYGPNENDRVNLAARKIKIYTLIVFHFHISVSMKKEVIHPQVPLRIPCDDLTHLTKFRFEIIN